ncbi:MAG: ABC transporter substrate-binding protein [Clostridia bacterium]|nr:ABC transporter substrate-binding protein [Clostridia bacterium]
MRRFIKALAMAISLVLCMTLFSACNSDKESSKGKDKGEFITVTDHLGNVVEVPKEIKSVAIGKIYPMASVISVFFDSAEIITGMPEQCMTAAKNSLLSELYPEILDAETGYINGANLNIEALLELNPDVYIYNVADASHGEICRKAGIPAVAVAVNKWEYDAVTTLNSWIDLLSQLFPENEKASVVDRYSKDILERIEQRTKDIHDAEKEKLFFLYQYSDTNIATSGSRFFGQYWADAVGAYNVGSVIDKDNSVSVNMEQIIEWNPECILITNFTTATPEEIYEDEKWQTIDAVKNKRVYKMPLGMYRSYTCGVDTPVTLMWIAKTVYPELFSDINITEETKQYYKEVFGIELTSEQADSIFNPSKGASAY